MTLVQRFRKLDYFVTMTCIPNWEEVGRELFLGQTPQDRPELVARVYISKLHNLHDRLIRKKHSGEVLAYAYVIEFQKCGLPHEHFVLVMANRDKLRSPNKFDKYISAEIPDKDKYPVLHDLVCKHMMCGPCGVLNDKCACMQDGKCRFWFPRQFCDATHMGKDSYPVYRRRDDGQVVEVRNAKLDNRWVVPFNPSLLLLYNCHINVEICSSIKAVKYLYKYIYKGPNRASYSVDKSENGEKVVIDEIKQFRDARCVTPPEAAYRLYGFSLYQMYPPVLQLTEHLPGMHMVAYNERDDLHIVINHEQSQKSMLTEYFLMNNVGPFMHSFLYREFLEHCRWDIMEKEWLRRKQRMQIGKMVYACPTKGERYYLRVLLNHVRGATSIDDLKTTGTTVNSVHNFFNPVYLHLWWYITKTLCYCFGYIFLFVLASIGFVCFDGTITNIIQHDYIFRQLYICHVPRSM
jgi:hypothetical protein